MAEPRYQHTIQLSELLEDQWRTVQADEPTLTFNGFVCQALEEAFTCRQKRAVGLTAIGLGDGPSSR